MTTYRVTVTRHVYFERELTVDATSAAGAEDLALADARMLPNEDFAQIDREHSAESIMSEAPDGVLARDADAVVQELDDFDHKQRGTRRLPGGAHPTNRKIIDHIRENWSEASGLPLGLPSKNPNDDQIIFVALLSYLNFHGGSDWLQIAAPGVSDEAWRIRRESHDRVVALEKTYMP